ncbi:MAG: hypothetical protein HY537_10825 [Deltaproteobacteria bacterium]|nr:hypothetical protein [Deltaproteobacteria bacterium]
MGWATWKILHGFFLFLAIGLQAATVRFDPCAAELAHSAITTDLYNGWAHWGHPYGENGNHHALFLAEVHNDRTGRNRVAFFKPRFLGDEDGWARSPMEYVAYVLNRKLAMDYIPPMAYRRGFGFNGQWFAEGAIIYRVPDTRRLLEVQESEWGLSKRAVLSDNRILNVLLQNPDGHFKNLLFGRHWVDGVFRPIFVDFGASFRHGTHVTMTHYPAFRNSEPVYWVREQTLERLRRLTWQDLRELSEFLSHDERREIFARRDGIVSFFDRLIAERGRNQVILQE